MGRLLIATTSYPARPGDAAGHFVETDARLLARQHEVVVLAPAREASELAGNPRVLWLPDGGLFGGVGALEMIRRQPHKLLGGLLFVAEARRAMARLGDFDRMIAHWLLPTGWPLALRAPLAAGGRLEIVCHGSDVRLLGRLPWLLRRRIVADLLRAEAAFTCVSEQLRSELLEHLGARHEDRVSVAPSPVDVSLAPGREQARRDLAVVPGRRLIVIVGRLIESKRVHTAVSAAALIPRADVVVLGDGPLRRELADAYPGVRFLGQRPRPEALTWIAAADLLVTASRDEGAPTVIREARALGVPVVTPPAGDVAAWARLDPEILVVR